MNDVTEGNAPGCGTEGFYAAKGWDPVGSKAAESVMLRAVLTLRPLCAGDWPRNAELS